MTTTEAQLTEARAVRYFDAARVLHRHTNSNVQGYWEPINYLVAMAAELTLKSYLLRVGVDSKKLKARSFRHNLSNLTLLAVQAGLRTSDEAVEPVLLMAEAHSDHAFRYTEVMAPERVTVIFHAKPEPAIEGVGLLLDHASADPHGIRRHAASGIEWPLSLPVAKPITEAAVVKWIDKIKEDQALIRATKGIS